MDDKTNYPSYTDVKLPLYKSHKIVAACQIKAITQVPVPNPAEQELTRETPVLIVPSEEGLQPFTVPFSYVAKHAPQPGGMFTRYEDGYASFSPKDSFDKGNSPIDEEAEGCLCQSCGCHYEADLLVPDDVWEKIKPQGKPEGGGLLCPNCIMARAVKQGPWTAGLAFDVLDKTRRRGKELSGHVFVGVPHAWCNDGVGHPAGFNEDDLIGVVLQDGSRGIDKVKNIDWTVGLKSHHVREWWCVEPVEEDTPAAHWREEGGKDPHGDAYDCPRSKLLMGDLTDDQMANELFVYDHRNGLRSMSYLQAGKDRIRWLSRAYEHEKALNRFYVHQVHDDAFDKAIKVVLTHLGKEAEEAINELLRLKLEAAG